MMRLFCFLFMVFAAHIAVADAPDPQPSAIDRWTAEPQAPLPALGINIEDFHWRARPIIIFGDSPQDPRFLDQMERLSERFDELAARDVVIITDTDSQTPSALRQSLRPRGFMLVLMGKDGVISARKPFPWTVREITRSIDKMPLRQREVRDR